ncbi:AAA family ATPase [Pseudomonas anuradhapurensis]|uniref:replicative DNA helicase n=1 Tax=Pseudomonas anuradhapurensis TaxID=485870 RepID=UPI0016444274|nr:DnaB-like helicase C-terminal domain-containing protein [Pseudomonas anuradhapurensis]QXI49144.1 AAA family ATPase [Pseudomonas anuradhapurensis]
MRALYSDEAEHGVLGAVIHASLQQDVGLVEDMLGQMTSADFYHADNAALFEAMVECRGRSMPIDPVTVGTVRRTLPSGDATIAYAAELANKVPSFANWKAYAKHVKEWGVIRRIIEIGGQAQGMVHEGAPTAEVIAAAQQAMADLRDLHSGGGSYKRMSDVLPAVLEGMQDVLDDKTPPKKSTGLADLDKLVDYLPPKSMIVIGGRPASGKTMLGLQILQHIATRGQGVGLAVSLEMPNEQLTLRSIASLGGVDLKRLREVKSLDQDEWRRVESAAGKIKQAELYLIDQPGMTMPEIRAEARSLMREKGLDVLLIDYLQIIGFDSRVPSRTEAVARNSTAIMNLSRELGIPIIALAQVNRGPSSRPNKKPQASDLKDSGQIEQDADMVILVHHDPESEAGQNGVTELIVDKNRHGSSGSCLVHRQGQYGRFANFAGTLPSDDEIEAGRNSYAQRYKGSNQ